MEEKIKVIQYYLERYRNSYHDEDVIDYYQIFDLDATASLEQLNLAIKEKKFKRLFHPDWQGYLNPKDKEDFLKLSSAVDSMINVFRDEEARGRYDEDLKKVYWERSNQHFSKNSNGATSNDHGGVHGDDLQKDVQWFNEAVKRNILKYGFHKTNMAIMMVYFSNDVHGFTRDNGVRDIIRGLGRDKIMNLVNQYFNYDNVSNVNDIEREKILHYLISLTNRDDELRKKLDCYVFACTRTILKYPDENLNVTRLNQFLSNKDYSSFTRDLNARKNLRENVIDIDGRFLSMAYLSSFKEFYPEYSYDNLMNMSNMELSSELVSLLMKQMNLKSDFSRRGRY